MHVGALVLFTIPAVLLWWHVWSGHPASTLTCSCGDPAQEVWFVEWPAWALAHLHDVFFSHAVNVPDGANLLSNTSGTLVGVVLAPVTWLWGPVVATNVALTLAPALSAWGCFAAVRPLVRWKAGAIPAGLVYGYSAAIVTSLVFGHVSVSLLVVPPLLFTTLHEIVIRQEHSVARDGSVLAALVIAQFLISPEVLVMCALLAAIGLLAVVAVGWRQVRGRGGLAVPALGLGIGLSAVVLAYPAWFGLFGPQSVTGVLFAIAPLAGVPLTGLASPGQYRSLTNSYVRIGGYLGRVGPPPDYLGVGVLFSGLLAVVVGRRRALTWLLLFMAVVALVVSLGPYYVGGPSFLHDKSLPWRALDNLPVLQEILADQFAPFLSLFVGFLIAVGLDEYYVAHRGAGVRLGARLASRRRTVTAGATAVVTIVAMVPLFVTYDVPLRVEGVVIPPYFVRVAPHLPDHTVLLTIPFAVSGSTEPMLWQAVDGVGFRLAGAALKTPNRFGGPVGQGAPGSARRILTNLTVVGAPPPAGTPAQVAVVRRALQQWQVDRVVISGDSRDPVYASGFFTRALGKGPVFTHGAWVFRLGPAWPRTTPAFGATLSQCRAASAAPARVTDPLFMASCVLFSAGRALRPS
jgi:hypothetical protein